MSTQVLIVQGSKERSPIISEALDNGQRFSSRYVTNLADAAAAVRQGRPSLVIFDISCWNRELESFLIDLVHFRDTRKIVLSADGGINEKVAALDSGADEFLLKPISSRELLARFTSVLRAQALAPEEDVQTVGPLCLYREAMEICTPTRKSRLSAQEFKLLSHLMNYPGRVFNRRELLEGAWIPWEIEDHRVVDVYIWRLREKIEDDPAKPIWIITRRGKGYGLANPESSS